MSQHVSLHNQKEVGCFCGSLARSMVFLKLKVNNIAIPVHVTVIVYEGSDANILCQCEFCIDSEFKYRCFKRSMDGLLLAYCKSVREMTS